MPHNLATTDNAFAVLSFLDNSNRYKSAVFDFTYAVQKTNSPKGNNTKLTTKQNITEQELSLIHI